MVRIQLLYLIIKNSSLLSTVRMLYYMHQPLDGSVSQFESFIDNNCIEI